MLAGRPLPAANRRPGCTGVTVTHDDVVAGHDPVRTFDTTPDDCGVIQNDGDACNVHQIIYLFFGDAAPLCSVACTRM